MHSFVSVLFRFHIPTSGLYCTPDFTAWDSYSALYQWGKLCGSCGWFPGLLRNGSERDFRRTCSIDHCLSMPGRKMFACPEARTMDKKCCTLAWSNPVLSFVFPLCILLFLSSQYKQSSRPGHGWTLEGFKPDTRPWQRAYVWVFVCVLGICWSLTLPRGRRQR